jgi:hypothetical protein
VWAPHIIAGVLTAALLLVSVLCHCHGCCSPAGSGGVMVVVAAATGCGSVTPCSDQGGGATGVAGNRLAEA